MSISNDDFITTEWGDAPDDLEDAIVGYVLSEHTRYKQQRLQKEDNWLEAWSLYIGTPEAVTFQRQQVLNTLGQVNTDWRHRINVGKGYEVVETIHGYLMQAIFPNNDWFNAVPVSPGYAELARVVKKYTTNKLMDSKFRAHFENFLRQLLIVGNSVLALPWRYETKPWKKNVKVTYPVMDEFGFWGEKSKYETRIEERVIRNCPEFETLDMFDCFLDPSATDPNEANFIRRIIKSKAEVIQCIKRGHYKNVNGYDVVNLKPYETCDSDKETLRYFQGVETDNPYRMGDTVEVLEYWGDVHLDGVTYHDVTATVLGSQLVRFEANPFWAGKPFIVGSCVPLMQTPYALGVLEPNSGLLHQLNIITNQRLDNIELSIDEMFTLRSDGVLQPDDVYTEPGKVFLVGDHTDLQPVPRNTQHYTVTYQEASVLEQTIDRNSGTGALISANNARSGERVTAAEIQAVRDAGGNRLSNLHKHVEDTTLLPILAKVYRSMQQFVTEPEVVRVAGAEPGSFDYFDIEPEDLGNDFVLRPVGADHVTDKTRYIKDRLEFLQAVANIPQMAQLINYEALLYDLVQHFGFDDPDSYVTKPQQPMPQAGAEGAEAVPPAVSEPTLADQMREVGGKGLEVAMQNEMSRNGGTEVAADVFGIDVTQGLPQPQ